MNGTIFLAGILQFQSRELFVSALEAIRSEEGYSPDKSLIPIYEEAMVNDTLMVLRHTSHLPASMYGEVMDEAYALVEFAGKGYLAGVLKDEEPQIKVAMASMNHPVIDPFKVTSDPDLEDDYLPRCTDQTFEYEYKSEGRDALVDWVSRSTQIGKYQYISFPHSDSNDPFNDWWDGHYYLKSGPNWYFVATDLDTQALSNPAAEELQLIMNGEGKPGDIHFAYVPGTESFRLYVHEGYEDVEVPLGEFQRCMKVRVDLYFLPTSESSYVGEFADKIFKKVTTTHYFGKGAGLVKLVFESGELCLSRTIEDTPALEATENPPQVAVPSEVPNTDADSEAPSGRPWWKFW